MPNQYEDSIYVEGAALKQLISSVIVAASPRVIPAREKKTDEESGTFEESSVW